MIPDITHPLGKNIVQPDKNKIVIDETHAIMSTKILNQLSEYSSSIPTGVYEGKMWKCNDRKGGWLLCWFGPSKDPTMCSINNRKIIIDDLIIGVNL